MAGPNYIGQHAFPVLTGLHYAQDVINPSMHYDLSNDTWHAMARWGFAYDADQRVTAHTRIGPMTYNTGTRLYVPHWPFALAFAAPPIAWSVRRWRRPLPGHCRRCGYDLRATPDRCPECGNSAL